MRQDKCAQTLVCEDELTVISSRLVPAYRHRAPNAADWKLLSEKWGNDLDERIRQLTLLRSKLNGCIGCGCLSMEACPLRNYADVLGEQGSGAQLLKPET